MLKTVIGKKVFVYNLSGTAVLFKSSNILLIAILIVTAVKTA